MIPDYSPVIVKAGYEPAFFVGRFIPRRIWGTAEFWVVAVGGSDDSFVLKLIYQADGAGVAEFTLQKRGTDRAGFPGQGNGLFQDFVIGGFLRVSRRKIAGRRRKGGGVHPEPGYVRNSGAYLTSIAIP